MMNSSAGFKKRNLLRPPSGYSGHQKQFLKVFDISQNQQLIASNIKNQLASIQEQINLLDTDKRIRTGEVSLEKSYILNLKKWVREMQSQTDKQEEDVKVLKQMGVDSYEVGFKKLWKLLVYLDQMICKITELQIVQFLKYDEGFLGIANDSPNGEKLIQNIGKVGLNPSNFYLSQISLERYQQLYAEASGLKRKNLNSSTKGFLTQTKMETNDLIEELREQNKKLTQILQQLSKEKEEQRQKQLMKQKQEQKNKKPQKSGQNIFKELEQKYENQIKSLNAKIYSLDIKIAQERIQRDKTESKLKLAEDQIKSGEFRAKVKSGTYEEALMEEMLKMKKGFEKKIEKLLDDFGFKEKESKRKYFQMKNDNEKLKWEKNLLMKKFQSLSSK